MDASSATQGGEGVSATLPSEQSYADAALLHPPYSDFLRELWNNQRTLRELMKPRPKRARYGAESDQASAKRARYGAESDQVSASGEAARLAADDAPPPAIEAGETPTTTAAALAPLHEAPQPP